MVAVCLYPEVAAKPRTHTFSSHIHTLLSLKSPKQPKGPPIPANRRRQRMHECVFYGYAKKNKKNAAGFMFAAKLSLLAEISACFAPDCIIATFPLKTVFLQTSL